MNNFLVTGGAGFIGSNLCEKLIGKGFRGRVLDNLSKGKEENMKRFVKSDEFIKGVFVLVILCLWRYAGVAETVRYVSNTAFSIRCLQIKRRILLQGFSSC